MRPDVYRIAYEEASAELSDILTRFDLLRQRKERIEKVVEALKPLVGSNEARAGAASATLAAKPEPAAEVPAPAPANPTGTPHPPVPVSADEAADPFARRVENVMGMGSASRDVREYSRLFSSSSSR